MPEDDRIVGGAGRDELIHIDCADIEVEHVARLLCRRGGSLGAPHPPASRAHLVDEHAGPAPDVEHAPRTAEEPFDGPDPAAMDHREDAVHPSAVSLGGAVVPVRVVAVELRVGRCRGGLSKVTPAASHDRESVPGRWVVGVEEGLGLSAWVAAGGSHRHCAMAMSAGRVDRAPGSTRASASPARISTPPSTVASDGTAARMRKASTAVSGGSPRNETETRSTGTWRSAQLYT